MASPQLSDISAYLVTSDNPARDINALDYERCAILHNFLVEYGWVAGGRSLVDLERLSFFERHGHEAEKIRERLNPSLVAFLETIYVVEHPDSVFSFWVSDISSPSSMFTYHDECNGDDDGDVNFLTLYFMNLGFCSHSDGLNYDQTRHKATMALGIEDHDFTRPVGEHRELWHPLETVLSNWIKMIEIGKITAENEDYKNDNERYGPWIWHSYSETQVGNTIAAFSQLVEAIELRMPAASLMPAREVPLLNDADLDAASIPDSCFVRSFLTRVRVPRFKFIAPGLLVPHDREAFISKQKFTTMDCSSEEGELIPPVLLFSATDHTVNFDRSNQYGSGLNPFHRAYKVAKGDCSVPAGLYSESISRVDVDNSEDGFRLLLPFAVQVREGGARKSDGDEIDEGTIADLFQHGFKPFGGETWRAQRLERLFEKWTELVEKGVWRVGEGGVLGGVETFRDAERGRWRDYYIEPDW